MENGIFVDIKNKDGDMVQDIWDGLFIDFTNNGGCRMEKIRWSLNGNCGSFKSLFILLEECMYPIRWDM